MRRKRTYRSSQSGTATSSEYVRSDWTAVGAAPGAPIHVADSWERRLLDEFAACMEGVATEVARGVRPVTARCQALQRVVVCATAAMLDITAQATQVAAAEMATGWDETDKRDRLTPAQREIVRLHRMGWHAADIAEALHVEPSTVYTHLRNARQRLREGREQVDT